MSESLERFRYVEPWMPWGAKDCATATRADFTALLAVAEEQVNRYGILERTMKYWEESYLAEHEHWGDCKWKAKVEEQQREIAELKSLAPRWLEQQNGSTHWDTCWQDHRSCALARLKAMEEVVRAGRKLAEISLREYTTHGPSPAYALGWIECIKCGCSMEKGSSSLLNHRTLSDGSPCPVGIIERFIRNRECLDDRP